MKGRRSRSCQVAIVGAGLAGLSAARSLVAAGIEPLVLEARDRVGGRTLTRHFADGTFVDEGGQWISPGQERIVALAADLGVALFPSWSEGATVHWSEGARHEAPGLFLPGEDAVAGAVLQAARELATMAREVPPDAPWQAPRAAEWDRVSLHDWLAANVAPVRARRILATAFEGVFASNTTRASLLAALFWARSGDPLTPFVATADPGPERRFVGGAQQISERMADDLGDSVLLGTRIRGIQNDADRVIAEATDLRIEARRAIITLPPALCARILYVPAMPRERDHLCQRAPMRWVIKVHCLYPSRFWVEAGLSGAVTSDAGIIRVCADDSPPSGTPGVLVGFIEEDQGCGWPGSPARSAAPPSWPTSAAISAQRRSARSSTASTTGAPTSSVAGPTRATGRRACGRPTAPPCAAR